MEGNSGVREFKNRPPNLVEVLKNRITSLVGLNKEVKPSSPDITISIFYGPHKTGEDQQGLKKMFRKADVYVPEMAGWVEKDIGIYQGVSNGHIKPVDAALKLDGFVDEARLKELKTIFGSNKPIIVADVPKDHPIWKKIEEQLKELANLPTLNTNFGQAMEGIRDFSNRFAQTQKDREQYMLSYINPKIRELLANNPQLRKKKRLNVLLNLGISHASLFRYLKKDNRETDVKYGAKLNIFSHMEEGFRKSMSGEVIDNNLAARIILELLFFRDWMKSFQSLTKNYTEQSIIDRGILSNFDIKDAEKFFNHVKGGGNPKVLFYSMLEAKGLQKPKTREGVERLLTPTWK